MAQASAWSLLRRLRRHHDPAAALLRRRFLSSAPSSTFPGALTGSNQPEGYGGSSGLASWFGSHLRSRLLRRQHAAATATRAAHQAASRYTTSHIESSLAFFSSPEVAVLAAGCLTESADCHPCLAAPRAPWRQHQPKPII